MTDDLAQIQQVLVRYANVIDDRDFDALSSVFAPHARASYSGGPWLHGPEAIAEHISGLRNFAESLHLMGNMQIDVDGNRAVAVTRSVTHLIAPDGVIHVRGLRYEDQLERIDGGWLITERLHSAQWMWEGVATVFSRSD